MRIFFPELNESKRSFECIKGGEKHENSSRVKTNLLNLN